MASLEKIKNGVNIQEMTLADLEDLSADLRAEILKVVSANGGHLSSNLGVVDLIVALNSVFDFSVDKIVFDVGHQCYAHKILNGRMNDFGTLRQFGGVSGFPDHFENPTDGVSSGHSSTSLSVALGLAKSRDIKGEKNKVIAFIGDGSMTGGMAYEAMNNIGTAKTPLIIILNDNEMSIDKNVGILTKNLTKIRVKRKYVRFKRTFSKFLSSIPLVGKPLRRGFEHGRNLLRTIFTRHIIFEHFNIKYIGPIDGHDIKTLRKILVDVKEMDRPILLHVVTKKGKGYAPAERESSKYHGVRPGLMSGENGMSVVAGQFLALKSENYPNICAITAAMGEGTGLKYFAEVCPKRYFDVGIAEAHAVTFSAGLAANGLKPYVAIYSAFLQRAYDSIVNDVCIPKLPITLLVDRAGITGHDGKSHQGILDIAYLTAIPNMSVLAPKDKEELNQMLEFSLEYDAPLAIRYGVNYSEEFWTHLPFVLGRWEVLGGSLDADILLISFSNRLLHMMLELMSQLKKINRTACVINARCIKPLDSDMLIQIVGKQIVVCEDNMRSGGLAAAIEQFYNSKFLPQCIHSYAIEDTFVAHGSVDELFQALGLDIKNLTKEVLKL